MAWIGALIGAGASAGGSYLSGQQSGRDARRARDYYGNRTGEGYQRLLNLLYGSNAPSGENTVGQWVTDPTTGQRTFTPAAMPNSAPNGLLARLGGIGTDYQAGADKIMGGFNQDTQNLMRQYQAGTNRLDALGQGNEGMARQWGVGREKVIRQDAADSLKSMNRAGDAALNAGGFNSPTIRANQYAGNQTQTNKEMQRALQDLGEGQIDRQMQARTSRIGTLAGQLGQQNTFAANRSLAGTELGTGFLNAKTAYQAVPLQTEAQMLTGSIANPWLGQNTSQYYPGQSALGQALQTGGNALAGFSSYKMGENNSQSNNQQLMDFLRAYQAQQGGR